MAGDVSAGLAKIENETVGAAEKVSANMANMAEKNATGAAGHATGTATGASSTATATATNTQAQTSATTLSAQGTASLAASAEAAGQAVAAPATAQMQALRAGAEAAVAGGTAFAPPESKVAVPTAQAAYERYIALRERLASQASERATLRANYAAILADEHAKITAMNAALEGQKMG